MLPQAAQTQGQKHRRRGGIQERCLGALSSHRRRCSGCLVDERLHAGEGATVRDVVLDVQSRPGQSSVLILVPDGAISVHFNGGRSWLPLASTGARALALMLAMSMLVLSDSMSPGYASCTMSMLGDHYKIVQKFIDHERGEG